MIYWCASMSQLTNSSLLALLLCCQLIASSAWQTGHKRWQWQEWGKNKYLKYSITWNNQTLHHSVNSAQSSLYRVINNVKARDPDGSNKHSGEFWPRKQQKTKSHKNCFSKSNIKPILENFYFLYMNITWLSNTIKMILINYGANCMGFYGRELGRGHEHLTC